MLHAEHGAGVEDERGRVLLLLHGLAGTADVWRPLLAAWRDAGTLPEWVAVDLPGHGRSPDSDRYTFGDMAGAVAEALAAAHLDRRDVVVLGHSLGGAVGLVLATGLFGVRVRSCYGLGIKPEFSEADVLRNATLAAKERKCFSTRGGAVAHWLRLAGLRGLVDPADDLVAAAVREIHPGAWQLAFDNAVNAMGGPDLRALLAFGTHVVLVRGSEDPMVTTADIRALHLRPHVVDGAGHNVHVQRPRAVVDLVSAAFD